MAKRAIPAHRVSSDIDDYLSYYYSPERDQLLDKGLLFSFLDKWKIIYFSYLKEIKKSQEREDIHLSEEERNAKYTHLAMRKILDDIPDDLY